MVRGAKDRADGLAAGHGQADVWNVGHLSTQENLCGFAGHEGFDTPNSIIFRFDPMPADLNQRALGEPRITPGTRWFSFEIQSTKDLRDALWWLNQSYEAAKK